VSQSRLHQRFAVSVQPALLPTDVNALQRGQHVATTRGCLDCHGSDGGGGKVIDDPALGKIYRPNLTHGLGGLKSAYGNPIGSVPSGTALEGTGAPSC
jgi:mono/diheme cytochrome c family protein